MYYLIYKTINSVNQKYYIGKHKTETLDDGYLGSGKLLTRAIKKYGVSSFTKEVIYMCESEDEMNTVERSIVNEHVVNDPLSYNIAVGGQGGNLGHKVNQLISERTSIALKGKKKSEAHKAAISKAKSGKSLNLSTEDRQRRSEISKTIWEDKSPEEKEKCRHVGEQNGFYGKSHSSATIEKMRTSALARVSHPSAKPITINGITYPMMKHARMELGISRRALIKLLGEK